jgi:hypothetical protein
MKNLFLLLISFCLLISLGLTGCSRVGSSLNGSGKIIDQPIKIAGFTKVSAKGAFPVVITQADISSVTVSTDDNLINRVIVALDDETLLLSIQAPGSFLPTSLKIQINMPRIYGLILIDGTEASLSGFKSTYNFSLHMQGASNLDGYMDAGNLDFSVNEGSSVNLKGSCLSLDLEASKASQIDLSAFVANSATVRLTDASEATVDVTGRLIANLGGTSKLYYLGRPVLGDISISSGSIIQPR